MHRNGGFIAGLLVLAASGLALAESRIWTDEESGRTIEGALVEKSSANDRIRIEKPGGSSVWVNVDRLVKADRDYAHYWEKHENLISSVVKKSGKGWREVAVLAKGGTHGGQVVMLRYGPNSSKIIEEVKRGEERNFSFRGDKNWIVRFVLNGRVLDEESALKKTGLRERF